MNIEQLKHIIEVGKSGSLNVAAKKLHITQSALSQSITKLEAELDVEIFNRSRNGAVSTEVGSRIIKKAYEAIEKIKELKEDANESSKLISGELRIGTIPGSAMFLPKVLSKYKTDYPNIVIQITEKASKDIMDDIKQNKLDIGLIGLTREGKEKLDNEIDLEVVLRGKMIVAASKESQFAFSESITSQEILSSSLVIYDDDRMWEFINDFVSEFGPVNILFSTNNMDAIRSAVYENLAITIGPDYTVNTDPYIVAEEGVSLEIADFEHDYPGMALIYSKTKRNTAILKTFIKRLKSQLI